MLKLQFKDQRQPAVWLVESVTTIGSDPKNHIVIKEEGVEARHAEIRKDGDALYLTDLGSYKGTTVNGGKVAKNFQLRAGDAISVAGIELKIIAPVSGQEQQKPPAATATGWTIMALSGPLKGKKIAIHGSMVFGRSSSCDIVVDDAHMSRRHAEINLKNGVLRIVDLQSSNGTCVNGDKVGEQLLKPGDKISFDHLTFLVTGPAGAAAAAVEDEEEDEATVFRAAPIPRAQTAAPATPKAAARPVVSVPSDAAASAANVAAAPAASKMPLYIGAAVVGVALVAGVAFTLV